MPTKRSRTGAEGERVAAAHLRALGLTVEEWNYRTRFGEIDLIARDGETLVFVEVKTRRNADYGAPEEAVTPRKQRRLTLAAQEYLKERGLEDASWRIDVVAITLSPNGPASIAHIPYAVEQ